MDGQLVPVVYLEPGLNTFAGLKHLGRKALLDAADHEFGIDYLPDSLTDGELDIAVEAGEAFLEYLRKQYIDKKEDSA